MLPRRQSISACVVIDNPTQSWSWTAGHSPTLDVTHRYHRDAAICAELDCDDGDNRVITAAGNRVLRFTALTHGFAPGEDPPPPPSIPPP